MNKTNYVLHDQDLTKLKKMNYCCELTLTVSEEGAFKSSYAFFPVCNGNMGQLRLTSRFSNLS